MTKLPAILTDSFLKAMPESERKKLGKAGLTKEEAAAKYSGGTERQLQEDIAAWLDLEKIYYESDRMDRKTSGKKGRADFRICAGGRWLSLEAKTGDAKLTDEQETQSERLIRSGGAFAVVRSLAEAIAEVRKILHS
jgi:hypothetical protein